MHDILKTTFSESLPKIDRWLDELMPSENLPPQTIHKAMRYSVFAGGKRIRPILCLEAFKWVGGQGKEIIPIACAIELIHAYSLIHDDLPAMDNDDFRRGKPTCHKAFGDAIAILAGDALHALAFKLLAQANDMRIIDEVAEAIGTNGLVGGQVADIEMEGREATENDVCFIHKRKTAALFVAAIRSGAIVGKASNEELLSLTKYAENFGLAFQITDDILDLKGDQEKLGKDIRSDLKHDKATYPKVVGLEKSAEIARRLLDDAKNALLVDHRNDLFFAVADFIMERTY